MSIRIPRALIFAIAFIITLVLYWPAINGTPIWDDYSFWFDDPVIASDTSYAVIWENYSWPVSVTMQKFLHDLWGKDFIYYHLFNLFLHFANTLLVFKLGRLLRFKYPVFFSLLFLFHPIAVITTAWMVQLKTLLSFFFALSSIFIYLKGTKKSQAWMIPSWILFAASVASKSASLTLPVILIFVHLRRNGFKKMYLLIPFFIISGWNAYMILKSPVTLEGTEKAAISKTLKDTPKPEVTQAEPEGRPEPEPVKPLTIPIPDQPEVTKAPMDIKPLPDKPSMPEVHPEEKNTLSFMGLNIKLVSQTMTYYFWQVVLPLRNEPVKGLNFNNPAFQEIVHMIFLLILVFIFWKDSGLIYLGSAHFLLIPFLGFIPAPYMNISWVSDQHLYLVLPALLAFWMRVIDKIEWKHAYLIPAFFVLFFSYKTYKATPMYKDQFAFYEKSLEYNPYNVPIAYNLAYAYLIKGQWPLAYNVASDTYKLSEKEPLVRNNIFFPYLAYFYLQLKYAVEKKHEN